MEGQGDKGSILARLEALCDATISDRNHRMPATVLNQSVLNFTSDDSTAQDFPDAPDVFAPADALKDETFVFHATTASAGVSKFTLNFWTAITGTRSSASFWVFTRDE